MEQYSKEIASYLKNFFVTDHWEFSFYEEDGIFKFGMNCECRFKALNYLIQVLDNSYVVYAIAPVGVEAGDTRRVLYMEDYICDVNYSLLNGCFQFDRNDGEIRYKIFVDCEDQLPSIEIIKNSIFCPTIMFERHSDVLIDIIFGDLDKKDN